MSSLASDRSPAVSVIIPCFNEEAFIAEMLSSIIKQDYPVHRLEIIVVDGCSTDRTRSVVLAMQEIDPRVRLIDNPERIKPVALNRGILEATGEIIVRMDAHARYPADYVRLSVEHLQASGVDNVGGFRNTEPRAKGIVPRAIARSIVSRFGSGGAVFRSESKSTQLVDTVFGGCYWKDTLVELGGFDHRLIRGQDREFNERLRRRGGRILFVPQIRCTYYARSDFRSFLPWNFVSGETPFFISRVTGRRIWSLRNLAPPVFVVALVVLLTLGLAIETAMPVFLVALGGYAFVAVAASLGEALRHRDAPMVLALPFVFLATHLSYGAGAIWGLFKPIPSRQGDGRTGDIEAVKILRQACDCGSH